MGACDCVQCGGRRPVKWDMAPSIWAADLCSLIDGTNEYTPPCFDGLMNLLPVSYSTGQTFSFKWIEPSPNVCITLELSLAENNTRVSKSSTKKRVQNSNGNCCKRQSKPSLSSSLHWWYSLSRCCYTKRCILWTLYSEIMGLLIGWSVTKWMVV